MISKQAKGPTLTWIFIGIAFAITAMTISMTSYTTFLSDNGITTSDKFGDIYDDISGEQSNLDTIKNEATIPSNIYDVFEGVTNVFVTGLSSIGAFFKMGKLASSIFSTTQEAIPGLDALFGLFILVSGLYIIMRLITARRGVSDTA